MNMKTVMRQSSSIDFIQENIRAFNDDIKVKVDSCLRQVGDYNARIRASEELIKNMNKKADKLKAHFEDIKPMFARTI